MHRLCWQLAFILRAFFFREKLLEPWLGTHRRALRSAQATDDRTATGMILNNLGMAHIEAGQVDAAIDCHRRALACLTEAGDERGATDALSSLAWARMYQGEPSATLRDLTTVLAVYRRTDRVRNVVIALRGIALALAALGRFDEALDHAREARECAQLPVDVLQGINCIAWIYFRARHLDDAQRCYTEAVDLADLADNDYERARALTGLGNVAALRGDRRTAERYWADAARLPATLYPQVLGEAGAHQELANPTTDWYEGN
jgi:tetratricopeptide (TPR) repeat protein